MPQFEIAAHRQASIRLCASLVKKAAIDYNLKTARDKELSTDIEIEKRIVALETKLAYLEDFVNQLQDVSVVHSKSIDGITAQCKAMSEKLRELADAAEEIPNRMPPHY
ncbi:SlyX family protein [Treponema sp. Marseille-Q4132]|uniref:SlyX family protein n=1 Tax=Treponema sp. Marseille-Q4132 TaxID=2766701 RepID=UPI002090111A|nr:SlyX family protein [Treponema sp. Marseille-Q4132]